MIRKVLVSVIIVMLLSSCSSGEPKDESTNEQSGSVKELKSSDEMVTINEKVFTKDDLDFYTLMSKVDVELKRHLDKETFTGEKLKDRMEYWDEQLKLYENVNVNLQKLIEIHSMALLAEEKGYYIAEKDLEKKMKDFENRIGEVEEASQFIKEYGQEKYNGYLKEYVRKSMLQEKVIDDLLTDIKKEHAETPEDEINYLLEQKYEDLYIDQVKSLDIKMNMNEMQ